MNIEKESNEDIEGEWKLLSVIEKRKILESHNGNNKKPKNNGDIVNAAYTANALKPITYSIKEDILKWRPNITFEQLLKTAPSIKRELIGMLTPPSPSHTVNTLEQEQMANCNISVLIKGKTLDAVVDTGAAVCVKSKQIVKELGIRFTKGAKEFITADGTKHKALGNVYKLLIYIHGHPYLTIYL
ncbi:hypothetical protein AX774_g4072 [Zancudomyces culisetae]|uniref:Uncharacterized protein n=1 Tax=Zancudomyces culisetae TaxID=1213189 RepID=A0A1R1PNA1_ZANCU|nr:hypothetical protein AX774_g4072 [Zancudomyces culisetae]|eukprot:OMH82446.1 hypothetical protein AX774_g4072 [Zancudomyces culisetae]